MNGQTIEFSKSIRYLGVDISTNLKNSLHLENRKNKALAALQQLKSHGMTSHRIQIPMKIQMYKTYIRPIIYYGIENLLLNKNEINALQRLESTIIKRLLNINKLCYSTTLLLALNVDSTRNRTRLTTYSFWLRLYENKYTRETLEIQLKELKSAKFPELYDCTINNILKYIHEYRHGTRLLELDYTDLTLKKINNSCKEEIENIRLNNSYLLRYNDEIKKLKEIMNQENKLKIKTSLEEVLLPDKVKEYFEKINNGIETTIDEVLEKIMKDI